MKIDIRLENICFSYNDEEKVLNDVSFTISQGEAVAIIGPNGSGKTSLVKHFNGLLSPKSGKVWIGNHQSIEKSTSELSRCVALSFQNPDDQICKRKVWDEVAFGPENLKYDRARIQNLVEASLSLFDLETVKYDNPYDLGYNERKRVALASVIAMDTPVVIFDEPTAGFDSYETSLMKTVLEKLRKEGRTAVAISHDIDFVAAQFPRVLCLGKGKMIFDGSTPEAFRNDEVLASCSLVPPQMIRLGNCFKLSEPALTPEQFVAGLSREQTRKG